MLPGLPPSMPPAISTRAPRSRNQRRLNPVVVPGLLAILSLAPGAAGAAPGAPTAARPARRATTLLAKPAAPVECAAPRAGRYVVMGDGVAQKDPVARILQETWNPDGTISGIRMERRGRIYREVAYTGRYRSLSLCRAGIERTYDSNISTSQAVLDASGSPRYSLGTLPDVVVVSRWFAQGSGACRASLLDGTVLSMQQGRNWKDGLWRPNAVIQNERWRAGSVLGIAISSYGPRIEEATYSGTITVGADCLATVKQNDSLGVAYNYRAVVLADGSGYLYLQTDPDDLTVGFLEHERVRAVAAAQR
jgi:hypothetical protein